MDGRAIAMQYKEKEVFPFRSIVNGILECWDSDGDHLEKYGLDLIEEIHPTDQPKEKPMTNTNDGGSAFDWEQLARDLAGDLIWLINNADVKGTGLVINIETGKTQTWTRAAAKNLARFPGIVLDWEAIDAMALPAKERKKFFAQRESQPKGETE